MMKMVLSQNTGMHTCSEIPYSQKGALLKTGLLIKQSGVGALCEAGIFSVVKVVLLHTAFYCPPPT